MRTKTKMIYWVAAGGSRTMRETSREAHAMARSMSAEFGEASVLSELVTIHVGQGWEYSGHVALIRTYEHGRARRAA